MNEINNNENNLKNESTRPFHARIYVDAFYEATVNVPAHLTRDEAIRFVEDHLPDIPLGQLQYVPDSDEIDREQIDDEHAFYFEDDQNENIADQKKAFWEKDSSDSFPEKTLRPLSSTAYHLCINEDGVKKRLLSFYPYAMDVSGESVQMPISNEADGKLYPVCLLIYYISDIDKLDEQQAERKYNKFTEYYSSVDEAKDAIWDLIRSKYEEAFDYYSMNMNTNPDKDFPHLASICAKVCEYL